MARYGYVRVPYTHPGFPDTGSIETFKKNAKSSLDEGQQEMDKLAQKIRVRNGPKGEQLRKRKNAATFNKTQNKGPMKFDFFFDSAAYEIINKQIREQIKEGMKGFIDSATRQATDNGIYVVAAAGNDGGPDDDGDVAAPGNVPRAISVGATTRSGGIWENSSVGMRNGDGFTRQSPHLKPEIVAPGHQIISTGNENRWYTSSGTSDSTVFVAGALALLLEANPQLRPNSQSNGSCIDIVKEALMTSAQSIGQGEGHHPYAGYGLLDAQKWIDSIPSESSC